MANDNCHDGSEMQGPCAPLDGRKRERCDERRGPPEGGPGIAREVVMVCAMVSVRHRAGFPLWMSAGSRQTPRYPAILPGFPPRPTKMGFSGSPVRAEATESKRGSEDERGSPQGDRSSIRPSLLLHRDSLVLGRTCGAECEANPAGPTRCRSRPCNGFRCGASLFAVTHAMVSRSFRGSETTRRSVSSSTRWQQFSRLGVSRHPPASATSFSGRCFRSVAHFLR